MKEVYVQKLPKTCMACNSKTCDYKIMYNHLDKRDENCPLRLIENYGKDYESEIKTLKERLEYYKSKAVTAVHIENIMKRYEVNSLYHLHKLLKIALDGKEFLKSKGLKSFKSLLDECEIGGADYESKVFKN